MNMLRIPSTLPKVSRKSRVSRKQRETATRLELTLEMPSQRPPVGDPAPASAEEPERGVAEVDFYI